MSILATLIILFLLYFIITGLAPFWRGKNLSQETKEIIKNTNFYGSNNPCIDRVALIEEPIESLGARVYLLAEAQSTIDIAYYAIEMGETTDIFLGAILDAAQRGIKIRILVDGMSGGLTPKNPDYTVALASHPNIQIKQYNPIQLLKPWTYNGRMHDKYIIIDKKLLLLGGRNIGDKYFNPTGFQKNLSVDRDVLVYNTKWKETDDSSVIFQVEAYFNQLWQAHMVKESLAPNKESAKNKQNELLQLFQEIRRSYPSLFQNNLDYLANTYPANRITFIHNDITNQAKEPIVLAIISKLLLDAKQYVLLQSPYFVLDHRMKTLCKQLGEKQITYEMLTNSMASSPNLPAFAAYLGNRSYILKTGAKIWELQNQHAIHAKSYLIDDRLSIVGSFNMDPRSAYIDTELMLIIDSAEFQKELHNVIKWYQTHSILWSGQQQQLPTSGAAPCSTPTIKKVLFQIVRIIIKPFKFLV